MSIMRFFIFPILLSSHLLLAAGIREISEDSICAVARLSLPDFLGKIPPNFESRYGFSNRDEFQAAQPGTPLRLHMVNLDSKTALSTLSPVALDEWRVPVLVKGTIRSLLTVTRIDGTLNVVELGGASLAQELEQIDKAYHQCHRGLLRVDQLRCDILLINCKGTDINSADCIPLKSAKMFLDVKSQPLSQSEVLAALIRIFQQNNADEK